MTFWGHFGALEVIRRQGIVPHLLPLVTPLIVMPIVTDLSIVMLLRV